MPGPPVKAVDGQVITYVYIESAHTPRAVIFGVAWRKTAAVWDVGQTLNQNIDDFVNRLGDGTRIVSRAQREYTVMTSGVRNLKATTRTQSYPGVEARLQRNDGAAGKMVVYVDKARLREFALCYVGGPAAKYSEEDARRFFDSFTFLY